MNVSKPCYKPPTDVVLNVKNELTKIDASELPTNWDWGKIEGVSYLTNVRNQHIP